MLFDSHKYEAERQKTRKELSKLIANFGSSNVILIASQLVKEEYEELQECVREDRSKNSQFENERHEKGVAKGLEAAETLHSIAYKLDDAFTRIHS